MLSIFLPKYFRIRNTGILKSFHQEFVRNNPFEFQKPLERKWKFHPLKRNHILYSFHKPSNDLICLIYYHTLRNVKHFMANYLIGKPFPCWCSISWRAFLTSSCRGGNAALITLTEAWFSNMSSWFTSSVVLNSVHTEIIKLENICWTEP